MKRRVGVFKVADYVEVDISPDKDKTDWVRWGSVAELERLLNMAIVMAKSAAMEFGSKEFKSRYEGLNPKMVILTNPKFVLNLLNVDREYQGLNDKRILVKAKIQGWQIPSHFEDEK